MEKKRQNLHLMKRIMTVALTLMLALMTAGLSFAKTNNSSDSNDRNGHMSWEEFFSSYSAEDFPEDDEEAVSQEDAAQSSQDGSQAQDEQLQNEQERDGQSSQTQTAETQIEETETEVQIEEDGTYTSKEEVAAYLHIYKHLPDNYITKKEARKLGWDSSAGNLDEVAPGMSIGGDYFGNYEGSLPEKKGRSYYECDIDYTGGYRGAKRIIFSDDGLIYYTEDHYKTFDLLYSLTQE